MNGGTVDGRLRMRRRRVGIGGLALVLCALMVPASADAPQSGTDPTVTLTVTPSTGLSDGQVVTVTGTGFPPSTVGTIRECGGTAAAPQCDVSAITPFLTTATGAIPPTPFTAKRIVNTGVTTFNCGVQTCALVATAGAKSARHQIMMAGAGTVVTPSTTTSSTTSSSTSSSSTSSSSTSSTAPSSSTSSTSTSSTVPPSSTSTSVPTSTTVVGQELCASLRRTQSEASAAIDSLIASFPQFASAGARARADTNAKFAQVLALAGC